MTAPSLQRSPSSFKLQHSSPLETLVRRASNKETRGQASSPSSHSRRANSPSNPPLDQHLQSPSSATPRSGSGRAPSSPLLHTQFRSSTATSFQSNDNSSVFHDRSQGYADDSQEIQYYRQGDDESVYSAQHSVSPSTERNWDYYESQYPDGYRESWQSTDTATPDRTGATHSPIPTLVVSNHDTHGHAHGQPSRPERVPVMAGIARDYSGRPAILLPTDEHKRQVLERNARRGQSPLPSPQPTPSSSHSTMDMYRESGSRSPSSSVGRSPSPSQFPGTPQLASRQPSTAASGPSSRSPSPSVSPHPSQGQFAQPSYANSRPAPSHSSSDNHIALPGRPPSIVRASSSTSVYSAYSFYNLDDAASSPTGSSRNSPVPQVVPPNGNQGRQTPLSQPKSPGPISVVEPSQGPSTPQEYLQLGIQHHEANRLQDSAVCFEKSATLDGGCGVGMLMWGLTLRHGWGCEKNEKNGFKWLRKAAEMATEDLESAREGASQNELVLAIYEVAQCFFQGWGVPKDQKMAVSYYLVAARLGDADAQQDLAFCLANGKGCKKDRKEAAKWYRAAVAQGASDVGLAWIYKEKFA